MDRMTDSELYIGLVILRIVAVGLIGGFAIGLGLMMV